MNEEMPIAPKKKWSKRKKVAVAALSIAITLILSAFVFESLMACPYDITGTPGFEQKRTNATDTYWTIVGFYIDIAPIHGCLVGPLKSVVYVLTKNAWGGIVMPKTALENASGTLGFNYTPASDGDRLSVDDVFSLNKTLYPIGSRLYLMDVYGAVSFAVLEVRL